MQSEVIDLPRPVMMHDFTITEHYAIFYDLPIVFALEHGGFRSDRAAGARVGIMPRTGTNADVTWYEVEPCTVFHTLNSYERGSEIVIQVCRARSLMEGGMDDLGDQSTLWQWTIDQTAGTVSEIQLDDRTGAFRAPAGPDAAEDEGWVLVLSHDDTTETTTLNILDSQDFTAPPVAKVR